MVVKGEAAVRRPAAATGAAREGETATVVGVDVAAAAGAALVTAGADMVLCLFRAGNEIWGGGKERMEREIQNGKRNAGAEKCLPLINFVACCHGLTKIRVRIKKLVYHYPGFNLLKKRNFFERHNNK